MLGTVKWFNEPKGYGFITSNDGQDVFCHYSDIIGEGFRTVKEGDAVDFTAENTSKGLRARQIVRVTNP